MRACLAPRYEHDWRLLRKLALDQLTDDHLAMVLAIVLYPDDVGEKQRWHWWVLTCDLDVVQVKEKLLLPPESVKLNEPHAW